MFAAAALVGSTWAAERAAVPAQLTQAAVPQPASPADAPPAAAGHAAAPVEGRSLTLHDARQLALENHPDLAAASYRAQAAQEVVVQTQSGYFPQIALVGTQANATAADTRILAGGLNNPSVMNRTAGGVLLSQLVTDFGRTGNLTASSKLQAGAASQDVAATREQVLLGVDAAYLGVLQAQAVLNVAQQTVDTRQLLLDRVTVLAENKLKSELDVSFSKVAVEDARLLLQRSQSDEENAYAALSSALGLKVPQRFTLMEVPAAGSGSTAGPRSDAEVSALIDQALSTRPELASLRDQRDAEERFARAQRDARLPTIALVGAAGGTARRDPRLPGDYAAGGVQFSMPLFAGGLYLAREREAQLRARSAAEHLRAAEDSIARDVRIAWSNLVNARERARTSEQLVTYANQAYELAQTRYQVGTSSIVEVSQAQLEATSAQIANIGARYEVQIQQSMLNYQLGVLAADSGAPQLPP